MIFISTSKKNDIKLEITTWNTYCSPAFVWSLTEIFFAQKYTVLLSTLQRNASTVFCSQQWTQEGTMMRNQIKVSSRRQRIFSPIAPAVTRWWTTADTVWRSTTVTERQIRLSIVNSRRNYITWTKPELYYIFFIKFCDVNKFEQLEMDTDSLFCCCRERTRRLHTTWKETKVGSKTYCTDSFTAEAVGFFSRHVLWQALKNDKREPGLSKEECKCSIMLCLCSKTYCCYGKTSIKLKISSKGLNKQIVEQSSDCPLEKYCKVLDDAENITSTYQDFRTKDHTVTKYERTKGRLLYFHPNKKVKDDQIHKHPLNL